MVNPNSLQSLEGLQTVGEDGVKQGMGCSEEIIRSQRIDPGFSRSWETGFSSLGKRLRSGASVET